MLSRSSKHVLAGNSILDLRGSIRQTYIVQRAAIVSSNEVCCLCMQMPSKGSQHLPNSASEAMPLGTQMQEVLAPNREPPELD